MTHDSRSQFTPREYDVAVLVADGVRTKRIADMLGVSTRRVRILVSAIAYKIGADPDRDERTQVALWWAAQRERVVADGVPFRNLPAFQKAS